MTTSILINPFSILKVVHPEMSGRIARGGGGGPTTSTVNQSNLPEYAEPYFTRLMDRAESESLRDYQPYQGQRTAETAPETWLARDMVMGMQGIPGLEDAYAGTQAAQQGAQGLMDFQTGTYDQYQGSQFGYNTPENWNPAAAQQYGTPYMQEVVERQKQEAQLDFDRMQAARDAQAVQAGAFGGSRDAVVNALAQEDLFDTFGDIQASGLQRSYEDAARMWDRDRAVGMEDEARRAAELARYEQMGQEESQFAGDLAFQREGLTGDLLAKGTGLGADIGNQFLNLGAAERQAILEDAQLREQIGADIEQEQQSALNVGYEDYLRQLAYPRDQLNFYSSIIQGMPVTQDTSTQMYMARSPYQDAIGAGISALGLYKGLT